MFVHRNKTFQPKTPSLKGKNGLWKRKHLSCALLWSAQHMHLFTAFQLQNDFYAKMIRRALPRVYHSVRHVLAFYHWWDSWVRTAQPARRLAWHWPIFEVVFYDIDVLPITPSMCQTLSYEEQSNGLILHQILKNNGKERMIYTRLDDLIHGAQ